jgi:hypothetical protein
MMQSADRSKSSSHWIEIECFPTPGLAVWSKLNYPCPRVMATDNTSQDAQETVLLLFGESVADITFNARIRGSYADP